MDPSIDIVYHLFREKPSISRNSHSASGKTLGKKRRAGIQWNKGGAPYDVFGRLSGRIVGGMRHRDPGDVPDSDPPGPVKKKGRAGAESSVPGYKILACILAFVVK